ncbi:MAG: sigma-70 family RNA polymerase sigma factor [Sedimentisphaerales bacterium]|nr:sigma-70 family RNA polymerase sigma factor [Sedimentisphaerales bacterium]
MRRRDDTSIGGAERAFHTTQWSAIEEIATGGQGDRETLINDLLKKYWKPVYCYLRHRGYGNEPAKDLTQGFFEEVVLGRGLVYQASQAKGSFRRFLLTSLVRYVRSVRRKEIARKRIPKSKLVALESIDPTELIGPVSGLTAKESFDYAWVSALLDTVLAEVETDCDEHSLTAHWNVFRDRVLEPIAQDTEPPSLAEICEKYGLENTKTASNMVVTVTRRLQAAIRRHLRQVLSAETTVEEETREIMQALLKTAQRKA